MKRIKILFIFCGALLLLHGQSFTLTPFRNIAPSPQATSLMQYADIPVSLYTGIPSISIPVYTIQLNGFSLPISLNYHASGIKVAQEASWAGLGWSLNAGGMIARTIRGKDDLDTYNVDDTPIPDVNSEYGYSDYFTQTNISDACNGNFYALKLQKDGEPDIFYYNFGNYSGKFYAKKGGGFISSCPSDNLKIELDGYNSSSEFWGWIITTPDGVKYYFNLPEVKANYSYVSDGVIALPPAGHAIIPEVDREETETGWYLEKIELPNGEKITFTYQEENNAYVSPYFATQNYYYNLDYRVLDFPNSTTYRSWALCEKTPNTTNSVSAVITGQRLKSINWPLGRIELNTGIRKDMDRYNDMNNPPFHYPQKLNNIQIFQSGNSNPLQKIEFHQSYFLGKDKTEPDALTARLRLDSLTIYGKSELQSVYRMEYDTLHPLPHKNSYNCDYWGYSNGVDNKQYFFPQYVSREDKVFQHCYFDIDENGNKNFNCCPTRKILTKQQIIKGANRESSREFMTSGMLTGLTHPTGGKTIFKYEANEIDSIGPLLVDGEAVDTLDLLNLWTKTTQRPFHLSADGFVDIDYYYETMGIEWENFKTNSKRDFWYNEVEASIITIIKATTGDTVFKFKGRELVEPDFDRCNRIHWCSIGKKKTQALAAGDYIMILYSGYHNTYSDYYPKLEVNFRTFRYRPTQGYPVGGVRISEIISPSNTKKFIYKEEGHYSSGILISDPTCFSFITEQKGESLGNRYKFRAYKHFLTQCSNSIVPLEGEKTGNHIGYSYVKTLVHSPEEDLVKEYYYYNQKTQSINYIGFPNIESPLNGKLKRKKIYSQGKLLTSEYTEYQTEFVHTLHAIKEVQELYSEYENYHISIEHVRPLRRVDSTYYYPPAGEPVLQVKSEAYKYNPHNYQLKTITSSRSQGRDDVREILYSVDLKEKPVYKQMCEDFNRVTVPVEETLKRNRKLLESKLHTYKYDPASRLYVPAADYIYCHVSGTVPGAFNGSNLSHYGSPEIEYTAFDSKGNNTSQRMRSGENAVCIWGYKYQYPVALIYNATPEQVAGCNIDIPAIGSGIMPTDMQWNALHELRQQLPEAEVIINTYDPLVGITSQTDGRGIVTYYEYDDAGRLKCIRNHERKIIESYDYHYQNQ